MINHHTGFLSSTQAANTCRISRQGLMKAVAQERIDAYKAGNIYLFKLEDVDKFRLKVRRK